MDPEINKYTLIFPTKYSSSPKVLKVGHWPNISALPKTAVSDQISTNLTTWVWEVCCPRQCPTSPQAIWTSNAVMFFWCRSKWTQNNSQKHIHRIYTYIRIYIFTAQMIYDKIITWPFRTDHLFFFAIIC